MKKLLLIRHAEAESYADNGDFDRPLSVKGKQDAVQLAQKLRADGIIPVQLTSSPSLRTATTAAIITESLALQPAKLNPIIYEASEKDLLKVVTHFPDAVNFMAMVGHNPGLSYLLLNLTGKLRDVNPCTAIMVVFEDAGSWQEVSHDSGVITYYTAPAH